MKLDKSMIHRSGDISVVIVTYNSGRHLVKCFMSLLKNCPKYAIREVIFVDNASTDDKLNIIESFCVDKKTKVAKNYQNKGFAFAVNQGIKLSTGDFVLLLNPDTEIFKVSLYTLVKHISEHPYSILGGKMVRSDNSTHGTYVRRPNLLIGLFDFTNLKKLIPNNRWHQQFYYADAVIDTVTQVDAVSGGFMLIPKVVLNKVGKFDERFFMYLEDVDYCIRAAKKGVNAFFCPDVTIYHEGGGSSNNRERINFEAWVKSRSYFFTKHLSPRTNIIAQIAFSIDELIMRIWRILS